MSRGVPDWLRPVFRDGGSLDAAIAAEVARRAADDILVPIELRLLLLVESQGPAVQVARRTAFDYIQRKVALASQVISIHVQSAGLPHPDKRLSNKPVIGGTEFEYETSLAVQGRTISGVSSHPKKKIALQRSHLDLIGRLAEIDAAPIQGALAVHVPTQQSTAVDEAPPVAAASPAEAAPVPSPRQPVGPVITTRRDAEPAGVLSVFDIMGLDQGDDDLLFDPRQGDGLGAFLLVPRIRLGMNLQDPPPPSGAPGLLMPDGQTVDLSPSPIDVADLIWFLSREDGEFWADSTRAWARAVRLALRLIREGRFLPAVTEQDHRRLRRPAWQLAPLDASTEQEVRDIAEDLVGQAQPWRPDLPHREQTFQPVALVRACMDAVAERFIPAPGFPAILGEVPYAADVTCSGEVRPLIEWADAVADDIDTAPRPHLVLRIDPPRSQTSVTLQATLRVSPLAGSPDGAVDADAVWRGEAVLPGASGDLRRRVTRMLRRAADKIPALGALGSQPYPSTFLIGVDQAAALRGPVADDLAGDGISVEWSEDWRADLVPTVTIGTGSSIPITPGPIGLGEVLDRRWQITIDGVALSEAEMDRLAASSSPLIAHHGRWIMLDDTILTVLRNRRLPEASFDEVRLDILYGSITIDGVTYACTTADALATLMAALNDPNLSAPAAAMVGLFPYQEIGLRWLIRLTSFGLGALLADQMGLGKTITALAFHLSRQPLNLGPTLVLAPKSVVNQWDSEAFARAGIKAFVYHGKNRALPRLPADTLVITSYQLFRSNADVFTRHAWGLVIADEAQTIKNPKSATARAVRTLKSASRVALTGTPMENRPAELWAILDWCNPQLFNTLQAFTSRIVRPLERAASPAEAQAATARAQALFAPFILRRLKTDPDLGLRIPDRHEQIIKVPFSATQVGLMETLIRQCEQQQAEGQVVQAHMLRLILAARKICTTPVHAAGGDAAVVYAEPDQAAIDAPKLRTVHDLVHGARQRGEGTVIFTDFTPVGHQIVAYLTAMGFQPVFYHGKLSSAERDDVLTEFRSRPAPILVCKLRVGGIGLNLTEANNIIHFDRHWNPALEDQCDARAHRIGQTRPVNIYRLVHHNSFEERMLDLVNHKRGLTDMFLASGDIDYTKLTLTEIIALVKGTL